MNTIERQWYVAMDTFQIPFHRYRGMLVGQVIHFIMKAIVLLVRVVVRVIIVGLLLFALKAVVYVVPKVAKLAALCFFGVLYVVLASVVGTGKGLLGGR